MVHLHMRSCYSFLKGTMDPSVIVACAVNDGQSSVCLTDYHSMHGTMFFYHECEKNNLKPIFGIEVKVLLDDDDFIFVNVLAKNNEGYEDLLKLSTLLCTSEVEGVELTTFKTYLTNLVVISLNGGNYEKAMREENVEVVESILGQFKDVEDFYIGMFHGEISLWHERQRLWKEIAKELDLNVVPVSRILYQNDGDESLLQVLEAIDKGSVISRMGVPKEKGRYYKSASEMKRYYEEEDLEVSEEIAEMCNVSFKKEGNYLPTFPLNVASDSKTYLKELCTLGLKKRLNGKLDERYLKRLEVELGIIDKMEFNDYFLIVWDYVRYAKSVGIMSGAGRGSAVGSLVSYCLGLTHIDPLKYDLLFERFLNPERVSMPDIDLDFMDNRRDEVIDYVRSKYGHEYVARISSFSTLKAKAVLRDVARVLEIKDYELDMLVKKIPANGNPHLLDVYEKNPAFKQSVNAKSELKKLFEIALKLEGIPRGLSVHAAGVVISCDKLTKHVPLVRLDNDEFATQFPAEQLEELGLLKMDFLSLRNLTVMNQILAEVKETRSQQIDIMHLPLDDAKTLSLFTNVETIGIFQFESDGMKNFLRKLHVQTFDDIVAAVALFRPGPMENIPIYIEARNAKNFKSIHPKLDHIVESTYGVLIYQEQIMQLAQEMAGFSLGRADVMRRAMSKKKESEMIKLKEEFVSGALAKGYEMERIEYVYDLIMRFANYGFNKSHSVAYAYIAYQIAYLKAHFTQEFFKALLDSEIGSDAKTYEYMEEAKKLHLSFLPFSVNHSKDVYKVEDKGLRPPLSMIKNVGVNAAQAIMNEYERHGEFKSYFDFVARCNTRYVNRKVIENLIDAGALDEFKITRQTMLLNMDVALQYGSMVRIEDNDQIRFNFNLVSIPKLKEYPDKFEVKMERERNALGFYFSDHPLKAIKNILGVNSNIPNQLGRCKFLAIINGKHEHRTKTGEMMAFLSVQDEATMIDVTLFPRLYQNLTNLGRGNYILVEGKLDERGSIIADKIDLINLEEVFKNK